MIPAIILFMEKLTVPVALVEGCIGKHGVCFEGVGPVGMKAVAADLACELTYGEIHLARSPNVRPNETRYIRSRNQSCSTLFPVRLFYYLHLSLTREIYLPR
jgi:hypothetical protein